jgi:hypothetical protein
LLLAIAAIVAAVAAAFGIAHDYGYLQASILSGSPGGSPAYWVYLVMAITVIFNGMSAYSRFRLWRIDAARDRLEALLKQFVDAGVTHTQMREVPANRLTDRLLVRACFCGY